MRRRDNRHLYKHGCTGTKAYLAWTDMRRRCRQPSRPEFKDYGGRGIDYAPEWEDFARFIADMGHPDPGMTLDRIDNDKGYSKDNCRWVDMKVQSRNRRSSRTLTLHGKTLTYIEWSELTGIKPNTIWYRVNHGWPVERVLGAEK